MVLLFACAAFTGCDNGNVPLSGTVTFSDDGSPLTTGAVSFEGNNVRAYGKLDSRGKYVVGTKKDNDGIPPGTYQIALIGAGETAAVAGEMDTFTPFIDVKFTSAETSGLSCTVDKATKTFDFQVERFKQ
jgi:hypothetical protein